MNIYPINVYSEQIDRTFIHFWCLLIKEFMGRDGITCKEKNRLVRPRKIIHYFQNGNKISFIVGTLHKYHKIESLKIESLLLNEFSFTYKLKSLFLCL